MKKLFTRLFFATAVACLLLTASLSVSAHAASGPPPVVIMETSMGRLVIMLDPKVAPITVENFLKYVDAGFYDGTIFHRVVKQRAHVSFKKDSKGEMDMTMNIIQGGGYEYPLKFKRPLFPPIKNEARQALSNEEGTIAMARTQAPDSATCQFYFNLKDNPAFNPMYKDGTVSPGYCAFGKVIRGMDVLKKILDVPTSKMGPLDNVPIKAVFLEKAYRAR